MVCGVVAEFNPFHNGHKYQLDNIEGDIKIAVISTNFVQRGEISILNQKDKTEIALKMGYDLVVALPVKYSIQNAEVFCTYASRILNELGVDYQVFGAETDNIIEIEKMIDRLSESNIYKYMKEGHSYNKSCEYALENMKYLYKSNNILAMEYIKAIKKYKLKMKVKIIKRKNVEHNEENVKNKYSSASYIRKLIKNKENVDDLLPYNNIYEYNINYEDKLFNLFKYILNSRKIDNIYDMTNEILNRMKVKINISNTYNEFLENMKARNISINRVKRIILNVVLDIRKEDINIDEEIKEIKILGMNTKGAKYIKNIEKACVKYSKMKTEKKYISLYNYLFKPYKFDSPIIL